MGFDKIGAGYVTGPAVAEDIWRQVRDVISSTNRQCVARQFISAFELYDFDIHTLDCPRLVADALSE